MKQIRLIGYEYGHGAGDHGCKDGPQSLELNYSTIIRSDKSEEKLDAIPEISRISTLLADQTADAIKQGERFAIIGGDNTCSIGTWSGAASAINGPLGLIWIDAHMDSHTPETTPSNNVHGMPLAALLSYGDERLTTVKTDRPKLSPDQLCLIGIRSFEAGEAQLLKLLGVRVFYMDEVNQRGLQSVMQEALEIVKRGTAGYGFCLDMDAIDPADAPGVGTPEPDGIRAADMLKNLRGFAKDPHFLGCELCEFNPHKDTEKQTANLIKRLLRSIFD